MLGGGGDGRGSLGARASRFANPLHTNLVVEPPLAVERLQALEVLAEEVDVRLEEGLSVGLHDPPKLVLVVHLLLAPLQGGHDAPGEEVAPVVHQRLL